MKKINISFSREREREINFEGSKLILVASLGERARTTMTPKIMDSPILPYDGNARRKCSNSESPDGTIKEVSETSTCFSTELSINFEGSKLILVASVP